MESKDIEYANMSYKTGLLIPAAEKNDCYQV
jgi:hypothetical protein